MPSHSLSFRYKIFVVFHSVSLLDVSLPIKGVGLGFYRRKSVFILCSLFTFQVVGCPRLTTWSGYSSHLWRSLKLWVYNWLKPRYYFYLPGLTTIGYFFFPLLLKKNLNTFLLLTTWLKVCNLPYYNYQHNLFGISYRSSLLECVPLGPSYMKIWGLIHREGFRLFLSLPLVTRRLNFFLFFDDTFHISFFFQVQHFDTHPGR